MRPDSTSHCNTRQPCLTLSEYVQNTSHYFSSNSVLHFLSGNHTISQTSRVIVQDVENISLVGSTGRATVQCNGRLSFTFSEVHNLQISSICFTGCGLEVTDDYRYVHAEPTRFGYLVYQQLVQLKVALLFVECSSVVLENVTVMESYGYGLLGYNMINAELNHCLFHHNYWRTQVDSNVHSNRQNNNLSGGARGAGGNALFKFVSSMHKNATRILNIFHSEFAHGRNQYKHDLDWVSKSPFDHGGGLGIYIKARRSFEGYNITIYNCIMYRNTAPVGANMILSVDMPLYASTTVHITNCKFFEGKSASKGGGFMLQIDGDSELFGQHETLHVSLANSELYSNSAANGGGLGIYITSEDVSITVNNCSMYNNTASVGANMFLSVHMSLHNSTVCITNCKFFEGRSTSKGGGFMLQVYSSISSFQAGSLTIYIANSEFYGNSAANGGGLYLGLQSAKESTGYIDYHKVHIMLILQQCICRDNVGKNGSGMSVLIDLPEASLLSLTIDNLTFVGNSVVGGDLFNSTFIQNAPHGDGGSVVYISAPGDPKLYQVTLTSTNFHRNFMLDTLQREHDCSVLYLNCVRNITIVNSTFSDNNCTSVAAKSSIFHFQGTVEFYRNTGYSGGALAFHYDAIPAVRIKNFMTLDPHTTVYIVNNTVLQYGGGILAEDECTMEHYCFFQAGNLNYTQMDARVVMEGNRAGKAGDSIFGGCLNSCYQKTLSLHHKIILTPKIFSSLFKIHGQTQSEVAATPQKVCFCERNQFKESVEYNYHCISEAVIAQFRGETFHVPAMIVGKYGYASPALVRTVIAPGDSGELEEQQSIQELGNMCENMTYSVRTPQESIKLHLKIESLLDNHMPLTILNISFRPCPLGFNLTDKPPKCDCALQLRKPGVKCNINTQLIHRPALVWIGNYSDEVVVHTNCPFDYCKPKDNDISLYEQNQQCAFNRSGVLCGACQPGLSLALGTSRCMHCSNIYFLLFIPFALAGIVLIILMLKCNLTVSTGTLNGLIFYANIIRANHAVFFPLGGSEGFTSFLSVFIAWLNLDLGVEVCLFRGMDAYIRTWLQFVFPLYIWVLVGLMICSSRYSTTIARLSGSNTVSVLATLFLLSYAKLLRTIIASISFTILTNRHGSTSAVWLLDGNILAMKGSHIPLVVMSIIALVVYVLPFTTLVLLAPWLQARSDHRLLRWVNKIKPLLDAYQGPYRDKFRYWTGLLLVVRIVLFAIFGGNALGDPRINLFAISVVILTLVVFWVIAGKVYKKLWIKLLESFFLLNLGAFAAATLFLKSLEGLSVVQKQAVLTSIMVGSAALVFIGILAYHCFQEVTKKSVLKHIFSKCSAFVTDADHDRGCAENSEGVSDGSTAAVSQQPTVSVIAINELREPLLTDS